MFYLTSYLFHACPQAAKPNLHSFLPSFLPSFLSLLIRTSRIINPPFGFPFDFPSLMPITIHSCLTTKNTPQRTSSSFRHRQTAVHSFPESLDKKPKNTNLRITRPSFLFSSFDRAVEADCPSSSLFCFMNTDFRSSFFLSFCFQSKT